MGKFFVFCRIQLKFRFWLHKKRWRIPCMFQFVKTSNKKVITEKPLTNFYEMNSSCQTRTYYDSWHFSLPHYRQCHSSISYDSCSRLYRQRQQNRRQLTPFSAFILNSFNSNMFNSWLLFISYKFVKRFWWLYFYYFFFLAETYMICVHVFCQVRNEISTGSDKRQKNFPIDPHCKNHPLW